MSPRDPFPEYLSRPIPADGQNLPVPLRIVGNDTELYWLMALDMYGEIVDHLRAGRPSVFIVPVGPVYQYRRLIQLVDRLPLDLSSLHLFFMDEYLDDKDALVPTDHPLSFRGFIDRELVDGLGGRHGFRADQIYFPDPDDPAAYDERLADLGHASACYAGVGINGHLAFNETPSAEDATTRIVSLNPETLTTNSHTALGGAYDVIPGRAVTVGMKSILASRRLKIWMNRPWQKTVLRKLLFGPISDAFPASFARKHPDASLVVTSTVAEIPQFELR